jgi:hypothetical protein
MEGSNRFRQTRIESEKVASENQSGGSDRVQFAIYALYSPNADKTASVGGMN